MSSAGDGDAGAGPVIVAYDGATCARNAIGEAGSLIVPGRAAIVLTVWQRFDLGFIPSEEDQLDAADSEQVRRAAERTAADGAVLADAAGFRSRGVAIEASPTWKGIVEFAEEREASLIVLGTHGRARRVDALLGSVARDVAAHSQRTVLIAHRRSPSS